MPELLNALINRRYPADPELCRVFWERLDRRQVHPGEAAALMACLSSHLPPADTVEILLRSLDERREQPSQTFPGAVNIVGTGGGPSTFNISTAAAFLAAAMGVPVVKTGSRGYTSRAGSVDLLESLGIPLTTSYQQTGEMLERYHIACAGYFVYPSELTALARAVAPLPMRTLGRFINTVGPFLAAMPVCAQLTGVSDPSHLTTLQHLAARQAPKRVWLCTNDLGADELLSVTDNLLHAPGVPPLRLRPDTLGLGGGSLADLAAVPEADRRVEYFLGVLGGQGPPAAIATVCLNAAALAVAASTSAASTSADWASADWASAVRRARQAIHDGAALELIRRLRRDQARVLSSAPAGKPEAVAA